MHSGGEGAEGVRETQNTTADPVATSVEALFEKENFSDASDAEQLAAVVATVTGIDERDRDTEKSIGTLEILQDTVVPANTFRGNGKLPFIVNACVSEGYDDKERQSLALVLNTPVAPTYGDRCLTSIYTTTGCCEQRTLEISEKFVETQENL